MRPLIVVLLVLLAVLVPAAAISADVQVKTGKVDVSVGTPDPYLVEADRPIARAVGVAVRVAIPGRYVPGPVILAPPPYWYGPPIHRPPRHRHHGTHVWVH